MLPIPCPYVYPDTVMSLAHPTHETGYSACIMACVRPHHTPNTQVTPVWARPLLCPKAGTPEMGKPPPTPTSSGRSSYDTTEATVGLEPTVGVLQTPALTTWLRRRKKDPCLAARDLHRRAEDEIRTRDPLLGKEMLYR